MLMPTYIYMIHCNVLFNQLVNKDLYYKQQLVVNELCAELAVSNFRSNSLLQY